jgi:hypothetical protein
MSVQVTFDLFSGRPNPQVTLGSDEATALLKKLKPATMLAGADAVPFSMRSLGYRGVLIEQMGPVTEPGVPVSFRLVDGKVFAQNSAYVPQDPGVENLIAAAASARTTALESDVATLIGQEATVRTMAVKNAADAAPGAAPALTPSVTCPRATVYEPTWWNDGGQKQLHNNCYNYACNYRTDTFAQPGRANGNRITAFSCVGVRPPALSDALVDWPQRQIQCPAQGSLVGLFIWPRWDYHWYRMDQNGFWSHKPGGTPVTNLDNSGKMIADPRLADRGRYTDFCGFMVVMNGHVKIS